MEFHGTHGISGLGCLGSGIFPRIATARLSLPGPAGPRAGSARDGTPRLDPDCPDSAPESTVALLGSKRAGDWLQFCYATPSVASCNQRHAGAGSSIISELNAVANAFYVDILVMTK